MTADKLPSRKHAEPSDSEGSSLLARYAEDPRRIVRQAFVVIALFFGVFGVWSVVGTITGAVVSPGKVKIDSERKTVQHLEGGIIDRILVREGEHIEQGQSLVVLESIQVNSSVDMLQRRLMTNLAMHARCDAQKNLQDSLVWSAELLDLVRSYQGEDVLESEKKIFAASLDTYKSQLSLLGSQISQIDAQVSGFNEQLTAERKIIQTLQGELSAKQELYRQKYLERSQILELERQLASHEGNRGNLKQRIAEAMQRRDELQLRIKDATSRFVEQATQELGRAEKEILQIRDQIRPLQDAEKRLNITAPVSGRIVNLQVHSKGGVIRPGDPLMDIVPDDTPLVIETEIPVDKVADVYLQQQAQVQMDAFDRRTTPLIQGKVVYISADRLENQTSMGMLPYYLCYVEVSPPSVREANIYLSPGMPATVFITTKTRSVIDYILEPLLKSWDRALRN